MAHTTKELALRLYNSEQDEFLEESKPKKAGNYQKKTVDAEYINKGVLVTKWWERYGFHEKKLDQKFYKGGKIYTDANCSKTIGAYPELN